MARPMRRTDEMREAIILDFIKQLDSSKATDGKFSYSRTFTYQEKREATVIYSAKAWFKTIMLVDAQKLEVGWYGVCRRAEDDPATFLIDDIYVYPQAVTGSTINPDEVKFAAWEDSLDDETFNNLRFHGHSHVNMGVFSSGTDEDFRNRRLSQVEDDEFFVFQVFNKRGEIHSAIYDKRENVFYENKDITTLVVCEDMKAWDKYMKIAKMLGECSVDDINTTMALCRTSNITSFLSNADSLVEEERRPYGGYRGYGNQGYGGYSGYQGGGYSGYQGYQKKQNGSKGDGTTTPSKKTEPAKSKPVQSLPYHAEPDDEPYVEDLRHFTEEQQEVIKDPFGYMDDLGGYHKQN